MLRRVAIVIASTVLLVVGSAAVLRAIDFRQSNDVIAQAPSPSDRPGRGEMGLLRELNLSPDQMSRIQQIRSRYRDQLKSDRDAARQAQQDLRTLMAGTANDDQIREKFRQVKELRTKVADAQFNSMLEVRNILTPEQRQRFAQRMEQGRERMRDRVPNPTPGS